MSQSASGCTCFITAALDIGSHNFLGHEHIRLLLETREVTRLGSLWRIAYWKDAIEKAGMEIIFEEVVGDLQAPLIGEERWLLVGLEVLAGSLCRFDFRPPRFHQLLKHFTDHGTSFIEMDKERMPTTAYHVVALSASECSPSP